MKSVGKNGRTVAVMMYENDLHALDEYLVKTGVLDEALYRQAGNDQILRPVLVKARKEGLHKVFESFFGGVRPLDKSKASEGRC